MVLMLALHGCLNGTTPDGTTDGAHPGGGAAALQGDTVDIATTPYRGEFLRAPVRRGSAPRGEVVVRNCYGEAEGGQFRGGSTSARAPSKPSPSPKPAPSPSGNFWSKPAAEKAPVASADAAPPPAAAPPVGASTPAAEPPRELAKRKGNDDPSSGALGQGASGEGAAGRQAPAAPGGGAADGFASKAGKSKGPPRLERVEDMKTVGDSEYDRPDEEQAKKEVVRAWDYGARLFLSNDDSMSLASAQRILWALQRNVPLRTNEIRPHELLNYFSFDSVAPAPDRTFGVLGSATQDGDTMTVALAVRGANPERQPLDLTLLVDRSCSMSAEGRMDYTKRGLGQLAGNLQDGDRIDLVLFDSSVCTPVENFVIGRDDPAILNGAIAQMQPHTGTNLNLGLEAAYGIQTGRDAAEVHDRNRRVLLVTDALLNEGQVEQSLVAQVGTNLETHDIRLSGVGVGREFNDKMLDKLTENGKGAYVYLGSEAVVDRVFGPMFDALVRTVAHDVHFSIDLPPSLAMEKFYGEEASTNREDVKPIHYYAGTTQLFLQDLHVRETGAVREDPITMRIEYRDALTDEPMVQELKTTVGALLDADPHNVQKGQALMAFSDWVLAGSMGTDPCAQPLQVYRERSSALEGDAEIGFVNGLVGQRCGVAMTTVVSRGVQLKLKLDTDQPIANVSLVCAGRTVRETLRPGDSVARFGSVEPGDCTVQLEGQMPMSAAVNVPATGGDLRCVVRGGRVSCS
jgi:Ca-activated chloride channel family protein